MREPQVALQAAVVGGHPPLGGKLTLQVPAVRRRQLDTERSRRHPGEGERVAEVGDKGVRGIPSLPKAPSQPLEFQDGPSDGALTSRQQVGGLAATVL